MKIQTVLKIIQNATEKAQGVIFLSESDPRYYLDKLNEGKGSDQ